MFIGGFGSVEEKIWMMWEKDTWGAASSSWEGAQGSAFKIKTCPGVGPLRQSTGRHRRGRGRGGSWSVCELCPSAESEGSVEALKAREERRRDEILV